MKRSQRNEVSFLFAYVKRFNTDRQDRTGNHSFIVWQKDNGNSIVMKSIDHSFYCSPIWEKCRKNYLKKKRFICERCGETATVVHHRVYLNSDNISDASVCYGDNNLEALCIDCHNKEHHKKNNKRFYWTEDGKCVISPP